MISKLSTFSGPTSVLFRKATSSSPVTSNLVLYFDPSNLQSYSGTGTTINDLSGNSLTGTMTNLSYVSPYFSYGGTNSQISIADNSLLEPGSNNWSMEAWLRVSTFSSSQVVIGKFDDGGGAIDVSYSIRINQSTGATSTLYSQIGNGLGSTLNTHYKNSTSYVMSPNTWYQAVYVYSNSGDTLDTYINGNQIGSTAATIGNLVNSTNPLYIGSYNGGEFSQFLTGQIGVVRIYNKALSSSEVTQNFEADASKYGLVYDEIREQLTEAQRLTYDAAQVGDFIKVNYQQYENIAQNVTGAQKYRTTDSNFISGSGSQWASPFFLVGASSSAAVTANNYIIAYKAICGRTSEAYSLRLWSSDTESATSSTWTAIGSTNSFTATATIREVVYFVRKKPATALTNRSYIAIYSSNNLAQSAQSAPTYLSSNNGASFTTYGSTNAPALQILATTTKSW